MKLRSKMAATAMALAAASAGVLIAAEPAQASYQTYHGCGSGVACVYNGEGWNFAITNAVTYGWQNLYGMYGWKYYANNQTNNWLAGWCSGAGKTGSCAGLRASDIGIDPYTVDIDMTLLNSVYVAS